jgi:hypothetical protein
MPSQRKISSLQAFEIEIADDFGIVPKARVGKSADWWDNKPWIHCPFKELNIVVALDDILRNLIII